MPWETTKRKGCMLCYPFEEKRLAKWNGQSFVQPKLDGVRCRAMRIGGAVTLLSSTEHIIYSVPHIEIQLENIIPADSSLELDGELYVHGWSLEEINSVVSRTVNLASNFTDIEFHIFDIVDLELDQATRFNRLLDLDLDSAPSISRVPINCCDNYEETMTYLAHYLDLGYEGIICRHPLALYKRSRSTFIMKFKPKREDSYEVVGFIEEHDAQGMPNDRLGRLVLADPEGTRFTVYSGMTDTTRAALCAERDSLVGRTCTIRYQHLTAKSSVPRSAYFISIK